jgi:hypothetical protein
MGKIVFSRIQLIFPDWIGVNRYLHSFVKLLNFDGHEKLDVNQSG